MADNPLDSFLVEIGFKVDTSGQAKIATAVQQTEDRVVAATTEGAKRRVAVEKTAVEERSELIEEFGKVVVQAEERLSAKIDEVRKNDRDKAVLQEKAKVKQSAALQGEQLKRLEAGVLRVTSVTQAASLGLGSLLSALPFGGFVLGVERSAAALSRLDVQSRRVGASAAGIQKYQFAMEQAGVDPGEATQFLEGFASRLKDNPEGFRQVLDRMGVKTKGPDGKVLGRDELLENFGKHLAAIPYNIAKIQATQMGASGENALAAIRDQAAFNQDLGKYDGKLKTFGVDPDKSAEDARKVEQAYSNLAADLSILNQKIQSEFFAPMLSAMDLLAKKLEENPQAATSFANGVVGAAALISAKVLPVITEAVIKLTGLTAILGGLGTAVGIAVNPVVALGASAESTPGKGVSADPVEREAEAAENKRLTDEANVKLGQGKGFWKDVWTYAKQKLGMENALPAGDPQVKQAILDTAEATKKLADATSLSGTPGGDVGGGGSFGSPSDTGAHGVGGTNLRYGQNESGTYRRGGHGGGGRNYADTPEGHGNAEAVKGSERDRIASAMKHLVEVKGWTPEGAAIAIGNAMQESNVTPNGRPGDPNTPGGSHYMFQWNNGRNNDTVNGRRARYERWMRENSRDPNDFRSPLDFMDEERKHRSGLEAQWHNQKDFRNAGRLGHLFEGYGDSSEGTRVQNARNALLIYRSSRGGTATEQAPVPAGTPAKAAYFVGDSIAEGLKAAAKGQGNTVVGSNPRQILDRIQRMDAAPLQGRDIVLSGGASNNPRDAALLGAQIDALKVKGVDPSRIRVVGVGGRTDFRGINDTLAKITREHGANFTGGIEAGPDQVHPHNYPATLRKVMGAATDATPLKVAIVKSNLDPAQQKLADAMNADIKRKADQHALNMRIVEAAKNGHLVPFLRHPLGMTPALRSSIDNSTRSHHFERHGDTFNVHAPTVREGLDQATKVSARREGQDRIRYGQGSQQ